MEILLTLFAAVFVLFLPGFVLSLVFFRWKQIDIIERIALSFALSIAVVPLVVFYTNLVGVPITTVNVILQIGAIIFLCVGILLLRPKKKHHENVEN